MTEHVQAFDYHRDKQGRFRFALYDPQSGLVFESTAHKVLGELQATENFLENCWTVWGEQPPAALAMDAAKLGRDKRFREFLAEYGVELRVLDSVDASIRGVVERTFKRTAGGDACATNASQG